MIDADRFAFSTAFMRIVELHAPYTLKTDAEAVKRLRDEYFRALSSVSIEHVTEAADMLAKGTRWPKPGHWLEAAQRARGSQPSRFVVPVMTPDGTETVYYCGLCQDTGWRPDCGCHLSELDLSKKCPRHPYERFGLAYPQPVRACMCRATNPAYQRGRETKFASEQQR